MKKYVPYYFSYVLHAAQDFYSHSNWVEIGKKEIFDDGLDYWKELNPYDIHKGIVILEGNKIKPGYEITIDGLGVLNDASLGKSLTVITPFTPLNPMKGLMTSIAYFKSWNVCPDSIEKGHWDSGGNKLRCLAGSADLTTLFKNIAVGFSTKYFCDKKLTFDGAYPPVITGAPQTGSGLAKDDGPEPGHKEAKELAIKQTVHEWCRLLSLISKNYGESAKHSLVDNWVNWSQSQIPDLPESNTRFARVKYQICSRRYHAINHEWRCQHQAQMA